MINLRKLPAAAASAAQSQFSAARCITALARNASPALAARPLVQPNALHLRWHKQFADSRFFSSNRAGGIRSAQCADTSKNNAEATEQSDDDANNTTQKTQDATTNEATKIDAQASSEAVADDAKRIAELTDQYLRAIADFRNLQTRSTRDVKMAQDFAIQRFVKDLLESLDTLSRAIAMVPREKIIEDNKELFDLVKGLEMTENVMLKTLEKHGVKRFDGIGEKFDPNVHEATFEVPVPDKEPGTVFHCESKGYILNGRTVRPAKVGVVKDTTEEKKN